MSLVIRAATREDVPQIYRLLDEGRRLETPTIPVARLKALKFIARVLEEGLILVAVVRGKVVGSIGVIPDQWWYSDQTMVPRLAGNGELP